MSPCLWEAANVQPTSTGTYHQRKKQMKEIQKLRSARHLHHASVSKAV